MPDRTWTSRQEFEIKLGRRTIQDDGPPRMTDAEVDAQMSQVKRYRTYHTKPYSQELAESPLIWKMCDICGLLICVNNYEDRKARTPRFRDFIVCGDCDPRAIDDRWEKKHYRIAHRRRLRIIQMAQVARAMKSKPCSTDKDDCTCVSCVARKLFFA